MKLHILFILCFLQMTTINAGLFSDEISSVRELYRVGLQALATEDYFTALNSFRTAVQRNPSYADARLGIAEALYFLGEYSDAYKEISSAKSLVSQERRFLVLEARILTALGLYDEAMALYNSILADRPYDPEANQGLGEIYAIQGKRELANMAYEKSLEYSPGNLRVLLQLVILHDRARERVLAENALLEALRLHPDDMYARIQAAEHYALYGEWDKTSDQLNQAIAKLRGPRDGRYRRVAKLNASLSLRRGDPATALSLLKTLLGKNESDILFLSARAYRDMGQEARAQEVLRLIQKIDPEDEIARLYREVALTQSIGGLAEHRNDAASWHIKRGKRLEESFYYEQALASYQRARRLDSTNTDNRLLYADMIRLMGFPEKYGDELSAAVIELENYPAQQAAVQDRLDILKHSANDGLAQEWGIDAPWNFPPAVWNAVVFFIPDRQDFTIHDGAGVALASYLADLMDIQSKVTILNLDGGLFPGVREVKDYNEAIRIARNKADYFVMLEFAETDRSFSSTGTVYLGRTGEEIMRSTQLRTGQEKVLDSISLLARDISSVIPLRMSILATEGDKILMNKGRWHGINNEKPFVVLRKGSVRLSSVEEGMEYDKSDFLGTVEITNISESLSEGNFLRSGYFDFITSGDEIFSIPIPEKTEITPLPDPAFRSKLLSVP